MTLMIFVLSVAFIHAHVKMENVLVLGLLLISLTPIEFEFEIISYTH